MLAKLHGTRNFQLKSIKRSTLNRGNVQRNHRKQNKKNNVLAMNQIQLGMNVSAAHGARPPPKKKVATSALASNAYAYSVRKNMDHFMPEYSVWKPATSSDSASGMSKGVRLVSAILAIKKIRNAIWPTTG